MTPIPLTQTNKQRNQPAKQTTNVVIIILINYGWKTTKNTPILQEDPPFLALRLDSALANAPWHPPARGDFKKAQNNEESYDSLNWQHVKSTKI